MPPKGWWSLISCIFTSTIFIHVFHPSSNFKKPNSSSIIKNRNNKFQFIRCCRCRLATVSSFPRLFPCSYRSRHRRLNRLQTRLRNSNRPSLLNQCCRRTRYRPDRRSGLHFRWLTDLVGLRRGPWVVWFRRVCISWGRRIFSFGITWGSTWEDHRLRSRFSFSFFLWCVRPFRLNRSTWWGFCRYLTSWVRGRIRGLHHFTW